MNTIDTVDLRPGQIFTAPVYSEGDNLLVPAKVPLRQKDIDLLFNWGIDIVTTEGTLIDDSKETRFSPFDDFEETKFSPFDNSEENKFFPFDNSKENKFSPFDNSKETGFSPFDDFKETKFSSFDNSKENKFSDIFDSEENELPPPPVEEPVQSAEQGPIRFSISDVRQNSGPYRAYKNLIEKLNITFTSIKSGADIEMRVVDNIGTQLLHDLRDNPNSFIDYILGGEVMGHELAKSSVNTAILSALTAQELRLPNHKIHNIVAGALLHDVGMLRLSKGITEKKGGLSDAELEQIKSHTTHTSKIITKELFGPHEVNLIALQHHERWDGKGYLDHLAGNAIDLGARIVSVADAFEAMVTKKSYRNSMVGYQAIKNLLSDNASRFDPSVIMTFTKIMGIYPIGSILRLNDKSVARVVSVHSDAPLRPVIQMLVDKDGKVLRPGEGAVIDLLNDKTLFIKNAIDPEEFFGTDG